MTVVLVGLALLWFSVQVECLLSGDAPLLPSGPLLAQVRAAAVSSAVSTTIGRDGRRLTAGRSWSEFFFRVIRHRCVLAPMSGVRQSAASTATARRTAPRRAGIGMSTRFRQEPRLGQLCPHLKLTPGCRNGQSFLCVG